MTDSNFGDCDCGEVSATESCLDKDAGCGAEPSRSVRLPFLVGELVDRVRGGRAFGR